MVDKKGKKDKRGQAKEEKLHKENLLKVYDHRAESRQNGGAEGLELTSSHEITKLTTNFRNEKDWHLPKKIFCTSIDEEEATMRW